jgi:transcriptional regulator with XRE-family HTH domain
MNNKLNKINPVDTHIGYMLKKRRIELRISLLKLGHLVGVSSQQIQKYETGENKISSSRLYELAKLLRISILYFFSGLDDYPELDSLSTQHIQLAEGGNQYAYQASEATEEEKEYIINLYNSIKDPKTRKSLVLIMESLTETVL